MSELTRPLIQNYWSQLSDSERELMMTGIDDACWETIWKGTEDDEQ
jgi:hypothetical protein